MLDAYNRRHLLGGEWLFALLFLSEVSEEESTFLVSAV